ncbi:MAG: DUF1552 domain-containing protein [Deltaproteobacteria bacterium]|nr:DUF1552 domain-containing protein [Deltaproteobacteria bacterium]
MSRYSLDRRTVLKGLLGGAAITVALPPLEAMLNANGTALADGGVLPRRFCLWFWGNGMIPERWTPAAAGSGDAWELSEELLPLAPVKHRLALVTGTEVRLGNRIPHWTGTGGILSGRDPFGEEGDWTFSGPTIDQILAQEIGGATRFRSLEIGTRPGGGVSFNGPNSRNPFEGSPIAFFQRIFGEGFVAPGEDPIIDPRIGLRRSVLDAVMEQTAELESRVGTVDKARLDQHLSGIRDLELRLARMEEDPPNLEACVRPEEPGTDAQLPNVLERGRVMGELAAMALACDQTRVLSYCHTGPVDNYVYPGIGDGHHRLTHDEPEPQEGVHQVVLQIMGELSAFISTLEAIPEGDGSMLDNMLLLGTSGVSLARTHALDEYPLILAGGACGFMEQDVHYRSTTRENASKVMLTAMRAMGLNPPQFGDGETAATESLGAIER